VNPNIKAEMDRLNITVEDIASHSFRKGARSYCQGGTTGGPSTPSILLRGGWALEGIDKKYVRYEAAADQFIGRILAMLSISNSEFAALHPHFDIVDDVVLRAVKACFPGAPQSMEAVLVQCLASLIFHREFLRRNLVPGHPLFKSVCFRSGLWTILLREWHCLFQMTKLARVAFRPIFRFSGSLLRSRKLFQIFRRVFGLLLLRSLSSARLIPAQSREILWSKC
jgi:hypothetical protein